MSSHHTAARAVEPRDDKGHVHARALAQTYTPAHVQPRSIGDSTSSVEGNGTIGGERGVDIRSGVDGRGGGLPSTIRQAPSRVASSLAATLSQENHISGRWHGPQPRVAVATELPTPTQSVVDAVDADVILNQPRSKSPPPPDDDAPISPLSPLPLPSPLPSPATKRFALHPASPAANAVFRRMSDFANYRRELSALDTFGGRSTQPSSPPAHQPSFSRLTSTAALSASGSSIRSTYAGSDIGDPTGSSQTSPHLRPMGWYGVPSQPSQSQPSTLSPGDLGDGSFNPEERRPSVASTTTLSSQGSRSSVPRGGARKLANFFGEDISACNDSEPNVAIQSSSYSHTRNLSNATTDNSNTQEGSPNSSRPRTPIPSSNVAPFLYQAANDIARLGDVPVRDALTGPDRDRYMTDAFTQAPPKTSASIRPGPSIFSGTNFAQRRKTSIDEPRTLRPVTSRDDTGGSIHQTSNITGANNYTREHRHGVFSSRSRAPSPSGSSISISTMPHTSTGSNGQTSPGQPPRRGFMNNLNILRRHKEPREPKDSRESKEPRDHKDSPKDLRDEMLRSRTQSRSFSSINSYQDYSSSLLRAGDAAAMASSQSQLNQGFPADLYRPGERRGTTATFMSTKGLFNKLGRSHRPDEEESVGPTDSVEGHIHYLDTNLNDMEGIVSRPPLRAPWNPKVNGRPDPDANANTIGLGLAGIAGGMAAAAGMASIASTTVTHSAGASQTPEGTNVAWDAPDSWGVRWRSSDQSQVDVDALPRHVEAKLPNYCIRIFRSDDTFGTLQMSLASTVQDVVTQISKKSHVTGGAENWLIVLKKHDLVRVLMTNERPLLIQKRLLEQAGYEERDKIEDIGREDNSYLCRFVFLRAQESDSYSSGGSQLAFRLQRANHIDLSGQNLITIPISLYSRAKDIMSLNLSQNLSLDLPRDFVQLCVNLRDIKFMNNEARQLPSSISSAVKLSCLDVSNNRLEQLDHIDLSRSTSLIKLNLANNRLSQLPPYFVHYGSLRSLNISSNFLDTFPLFVCALENLGVLDLSFNNIDKIPDSISKLRNLDKLVITNNRLSGPLPSSIANLRCLQHLDIKYNAISQIDVLADLPRLETLTAEHNYITTFTGSFTCLRHLRLNSNPLTKFEINAPLPTLKQLNLSNAQLASIDQSFVNMTNLEQLILDNNIFASFPAMLGTLRKLEVLSIANNSVGELPPEIGCLSELRVLDIHGNNIRRLPPELWWASKLETLNASSNVLDVFPKASSRPPQPPGDTSSDAGSVLRAKTGAASGLTPRPSAEVLTDDSRRPSTVSTTLLSVGPSPVPCADERKTSVVSVYGKGGRQTSVVSRSTAHVTPQQAPPVPPLPAAPLLTTRKDSGTTTASKNSITFAGSLRNLFLADNRLDDEVFEQLAQLTELRVLNLSYNVLSDMPQRTMKSWHQLVELYLSGNELTTIPADDLDENTPLQVLHINGNKFTNLPADISRAKNLSVLDCGSNYLKYNISNVPYDWNWNLNPNLRYLNLSGNKRLEIKHTMYPGVGPFPRERYSDFNRMHKMRVLGLMDVTLPPLQPSLPDQNEDRRVRTADSSAGHLPYGMADALGKNEHLSTLDLLVPRFNGNDTEILMGLFDGQSLSSGGSKVAKFLHENFGNHLANEMKAVLARTKNPDDTPVDALRRAFLSLNKDLVTLATQYIDSGLQQGLRQGSAAPTVLNPQDLRSGGVATILYLQNTDLYVANVGDAAAMMTQTDGSHRVLTMKHDPAEPMERQRIRDAGGWVSRSGRLNDELQVSRAFGYLHLMPAVQAAPYVTHVHLTEQDEAIIIATKEVWEYLTPGLVTDVVRAERGDLMRAAEKIRDLAIAYGASNKIMVMLISVVDVKRRMDRNRLHRGQSMLLHPSGVPGVLSLQPRRMKKQKGDILDSGLQRLGEEVPAPKGFVAIVFTDIKNSTTMWELHPDAMRAAIKAHNEVMRRCLRRVGGFEVKTEGDAFMVSFSTATSALLWCFEIQKKLLHIDWPAAILNTASGQVQYDKDNNIIFKGLSVRMGAHWGEPVCEIDPVTRRMDYFGPMVNRASRISSVADGGQITVSSDFISEIKRCLDMYQDTERHASVGSEESFDGEVADQVRNELRSLMKEGFEVKDMGEKKLKGLENPESVYSLYPYSLVGRIDAHRLHELKMAAPTDEIRNAAVFPENIRLALEPENLWELWKVSLRLEMLCSNLEVADRAELHTPEVELLSRMKSRGGELTETAVISYTEHLIVRIEMCIANLYMRHLAMGCTRISSMNDLKGSMTDILNSFTSQAEELKRYKRIHGTLDPGD